MKKYDVVTIGDGSEDIFVRPKNLRISHDLRYASGRGATFELGEKIQLEDVQYEIGGSACNNAVAFSRMGFKASAIIALGPDTPGEKVKEKLLKEGVDIEFLKNRLSYKTNFSVVFNIGDERTIFVYHGLEDYCCLKPNLDLSTDWIFLAPLGPHSQEVTDRVVTLAAEKNTRIAWNPGGRQIEKTARHYKQLLACTELLFLNREEAIKFINYPIAPKREELLRALHDKGAKVVVLTDGKKGASAYDGEHYYHADIIPVEKVDATGAGDSFATGFTGRVMRASEISPGVIMEALAWGIVNSTSVVGFVGAQKGLLSADKIEEEVKNTRINIEMD